MGELGRPKSPSPQVHVLGEEVRNLSHFESLDVVDIGLADFGLGITPVLLEYIAHVPAKSLTNDANHAAGAMLHNRYQPDRSTKSTYRRGEVYLSVVTVNQERVIGLVEYQPEDGLHRRNGNGFFLGALHVKDMMLDSISAEKSIIALGEVLLDQCAGKPLSVRWKR